MLSKDLTPNPKAVNIIRPFNQQTQQQQQQQQQTQQYLFSNQLLQQPYNGSSSSSTSSITTMTTTPMIRQLSAESNPGLSFFCHSSNNTNNNNKTNTVANHSIITTFNVQNSSFDNQHKPTLKTPSANTTPALVISRINLPNYVKKHRPTDQVESVITNKEEEKERVLSSSPTTDNKISTFKPGIGFIGSSGGGVGSFLLRGRHILQSSHPLEEARVYQKIEDLEIEKKSLLTLNQTLETVIKEQSMTISDLQNRLAAIERPLTPGLDTTLSEDDIMQPPSPNNDDILELEKCIKDEDAAFERIRTMLVDLIDQAQTAVSQNNRQLIDASTNTTYATSPKHTSYPSLPNRRPKSLIIHSSTNTNQQPFRRRLSSSGINTTSTKISPSSSPVSTKIGPSSPPSTSPIPNRRYSVQRSVTRSSSPSFTTKKKVSSSSKHTTMKYNKAIHDSQQQTKKWIN
ncbi:uncharacterized protein BX663DRAFT_560417 [Cokeromyces recurvatus]|uniref:uncharacterized protein n=1 Tax=Cokeromyces recurvatus TaxID=90255 RepID=UPI002220E02D|nr:uncharacterized protein BX663DRAFT_560417 [Cokeromyces recurvatus]KAI7904090.1 hypothetical protein BX663DRAFT_560417 [Cokeromyces recurvatus]